MSIKSEDWIKRARMALNLNAYENYAPEYLLNSARMNGNPLIKMEVFYSLMNYWKMKYEEKGELPSVARDCILAESTFKKDCL